jgi:hypothetical protein
MVSIWLSSCHDQKDELVQQDIPINFASNEISFKCNEQFFSLSKFFAERNGYKENEVVFRCSGEGLFNTLMITFKPLSKGDAIINKDMTGYWDLGLCIPFNKYLLTDDKSNYIRIDSYDENTQIITGEFELTFASEKTQNVIIKFSNGKFKAKIDATYPFRYCIEG